MHVGVVTADRAAQCTAPVQYGDVAAVGVAADILEGPVGLVQQAVLDDHGRAVADEAVTLHLTEPQTALSGAAFGRLPGQYLHRATGTNVHLAGHHVVQLLIVDHADEYVGVDLA